jgi:hypothetical protein
MPGIRLSPSSPPQFYIQASGHQLGGHCQSATRQEVPGHSSFYVGTALAVAGNAFPTFSGSAGDSEQVKEQKRKEAMENPDVTTDNPLGESASPKGENTDAQPAATDGDGRPAEPLKGESQIFAESRRRKRLC